MKLSVFALIFACTALTPALAEESTPPLQTASDSKFTLPEVNRKNCSDLELLKKISAELEKPDAVKLYTTKELQEFVDFSEQCLVVLRN
ncbi:MAG: hypothetical protein K6F05_02845 [Succinivibrio sp.]|nr:hypothetical protein [Succinivibrio sp.]